MNDVNAGPALAVEPTVVEGVLYDCPEGLVVAPDCLGRGYATVISGRQMIISFPRAWSDDPDQQLPQLTPDMYYGHGRPTTDNPGSEPAPPVRRLSPWGAVISADVTGWVCAEVRRVSYRFDYTGSDEDLARVCAEIESGLDKWWQLLIGWIDIHSELDLLGHGRNSGIPRHAVGMSVYVGDGPGQPARTVSWRSSNSRRTIFIGRQGIVPDDAALKQCFRLAGEGADLPQGWTYLREARSWLNAGQTRRAVIDACTAAEVALAHQVRQLLTGTNSAEVDRLLGRCSGIASTARAVRDNGGRTASRHKVEVKLAKVRNEAAHAGKEPDLDVASDAVAVAAEIVEQVWPVEKMDRHPQ